MASEGTVLAGKYRLEKRLGSGGFATVWRARNVLIDRPVALKILSAPVFRLPGAVDRFVREARLAAMELHPTVVRVEDMGTTDSGVPFLVMELLRGETLSQVLKREKTLPLETCLGIVRPILEGLAAAHNKGIIHRDVKPGNIFLVTEGTAGPAVRILDMGIAKNLDDPERITSTGQFVGTPKYLAPEVMLEQSQSAWRPAVDVFSLGMLTFKMLTGELPTKAGHGLHEAAQIVLQMEEYEKLAASGGDLPGPRSVRPDVPAPIDRFLRRAIAVSWTKRYADAKEMLVALDEAIARLGLESATPAKFVRHETLQGLRVDEVTAALEEHHGGASTPPSDPRSITPGSLSTLTPVSAITAEFLERSPQDKASSFELALVVEDALSSTSVTNETGVGSAPPSSCVLASSSQVEMPNMLVSSPYSPTAPSLATPTHSAPPPASVETSPVPSRLSPAPPEVSPTPLPPLPELSPTPASPADGLDADETQKMDGPPEAMLDAEATLKLDRSKAVLTEAEAPSRPLVDARVVIALVVVVLLGTFVGWLLLSSFGG